MNLTHALFIILIKPNDVSILGLEVFFQRKFEKETNKGEMPVVH